MWDLFCGVGGFGLHCAGPETQLTGIEINAEAIACARQSAEQLGLKNVSFAALDSTRFATAEAQIPELVLVNPPRRGIGRELCDYLSQMAPKLFSIQVVMQRRWRKISVCLRVTTLNGYSCLICSRIPVTTKCSPC